MAFQYKHTNDGKLSRAFIKFGKTKELSITPYKGKTYLHISDSKNCFTSGKFDFSKTKSISFNEDEVKELIRLVPSFERYNALFTEEQSASGTPNQGVSSKATAVEITPPRGGATAIAPFRADANYYVITPPQEQSEVTPPVQPVQPQQQEIVNQSASQATAVEITPPRGGATAIAPLRADANYYVITPPQEQSEVTPPVQPVQPQQQEIVDLTDDQILFAVPLDGLTQI